MIIDCPHCDSKVEVDEKGHVDLDLEVAGGVPSKLALVECKVCHNTLLGLKTLASGLKYLKDKEIIDGRLYEWGEALRSARNLGAHASTEKVSREDARDLLDFSVAICEYVFVLNAKFARFKDRQKNA